MLLTNIDFSLNRLVLSTYIARQPLIDRDSRIIAYELLYRDSHRNQYSNVGGDYATRSVLADLLLDKSNNLLNGSMAFVNFSHQSIIDGLPLCMKPGSIIIEILEGDNPSLELFEAVKTLYQKGYIFALDDFIPSASWEAFLPFVAIIKIDIMQYSLFDAHLFIQSYKHLNIQFLAEKIEHEYQYRQAMKSGFHLFQGYYFARPEMLEKQILDPSYLVWFNKVYRHLCTKKTYWSDLSLTETIDISYSASQNIVQYSPRYSNDIERLYLEVEPEFRLVSFSSSA